MSTQSTTGIFKQAAGASIGWGVVMIVLGILALFLPLATGIGVSIAVGWIIVFSGVAYLASAFAARGAGSFLWRLLIGAVYILGGLYLAFNPGLALESLTLAMAVMFFVEGALETVVFFQLRSLPGSGWVLFDGLVTLFLAYLIWRPWPSSSIWAIGTILGINLISSGFTRLMYSVAARRTLEAVS
ncbi:MAG: HdeD family acid-resistance protein [Terracidiphilus sp.]